MSEPFVPQDELKLRPPDKQKRGQNADKRPSKMDWGAQKILLCGGRVRLTGAEHYAIVPKLNFERRSLLRGRLDGRKISDGLCREARR